MGGQARGMNASDLNKGVMIHEIGHNLGGDHADGTSVMSIVSTTEFRNIDGRVNVQHSYPSMSNNFTPVIFNRRDTPRVSPLGRLWTQRNR